MGLEQAFKESLVRPGASVVITTGSFGMAQNHMVVRKSHTENRATQNREND